MVTRRPTLTVLLVLILLLLFATTAATARTHTVRVEALIDGRSQIRLSGDVAQWQHLDHAAPGRHEFADEPTLVDGVRWFPRWPDVPDRENRDCHCLSSADPVLAVPLPLVDAQVSLRAIDTRWPPTIVETPSVLNGYTVVVELDDRGFTGSYWWIVEIDVRPRAVVFREFALDDVDVALGGRADAADSVGAAGRFEPDPAGDGIDPLGEEVTLSVGGLHVTIPSGSFTAQGAVWSFRGAATGAAHVDAVLAELDGGGYAFAIRASGADVAEVRDPERIGLAIGDDEGRASARLAGRLRAGPGVRVLP